MIEALANSQEGAASLGKKIAILVAALIAYGSNFWPEPAIRTFGLNALGNPQYAGFVGIFLPHLLLYTTVMAAVSAVLWWMLARAELLPPPQLANLRQSIVPGIIGGFVALMLTLAVIWAAFPAGLIHWIAPDTWKIAGNLFSNFFEEFVFRGFLLVAWRRLVGFWPAALISSAMWGFTHTQYPLILQLSIVAVGIGFCWLARHVRSLWAPYIAHEVLDVIGDSLIG